MKNTKGKNRRIPACVICFVLIIGLLPAEIPFVSGAAYENTHMNTGNQADDMVSVAQTQIGYMEGSLEGTVQGSNNHTKYGAWYTTAHAGGDTYFTKAPWCAMFVSWCANQAGISTSILPAHASCDIGMNWFKNRGQWGWSAGWAESQGENAYQPKKGDIIYFGSGDLNDSNHVGIVTGVSGNTVYTIEGNTSDMVKNRSYALSDRYIYGYGKPNYSASGTYPTGKYKITADSLTVRKGPGTGYESAGALSAGTVITVTEVSNTHWGKFNYNGTECWISIHTAYAVFVEPLSSYQTGQYRVTASALNVRKGPSTDYESVGTLANGTVFDVYKIENTYWGMINYKGDPCWIACNISYALYLGDTPVQKFDGKEITFDSSSKINWIFTGEPKQYTNVRLSDQTLKLTAVQDTSDAFVYLNYCKSAYVDTFSAAAYRYIALTMKSDVTSCSQAELYLCSTGGVSVPTSGKSVKFNTINDGQWHTYVIDLAASGCWSGEVLGLRLDYFDGNVSAGSSVYIKSIKFSETKPADPTEPPAEKHLVKITLTPPYKTSYDLGTALDPAGMTVTAHYSDGTQSVVASGYTLSGYNSSQEGTQTITVTYQGANASFLVTLTAPVVTGITVQAPKKTVYTEGEPLNLTGGSITVSYSNQTQQTYAMQSDMLSGYQPNQIGPQDISVSYGGKSASFVITVQPKIIVLTKITVIPPNKIDYIEGEPFEDLGLIVTAHYSDGSAAVVTNRCAVFGYTSVPGVKTITVAFEDQKAAFTVTVKEKILTRITVQPPNKLVYGEGEAFSASGMKVTAYYNNNTAADVTLFAEISGFESVVGVRTVTVSYQGQAAEFMVTIKETPAPPAEITSNRYSVADGYLRGKLAGETTAALLNTIPQREYVAIYKNGRAVSADTILSTGMTAVLNVNGDIKQTLTIIVNGDISGDGIVNSVDLLLLKQHLVRMRNLTGSSLLAADMNGDGSANSLDLLLLQQSILRQDKISLPG